jgi:hypothetical protein
MQGGPKIQVVGAAPHKPASASMARRGPHSRNNSEVPAPAASSTTAAAAVANAAKNADVKSTVMESQHGMG